MPVYTPSLKAYRSCGFHNHTIAELRDDESLRRRAVLTDDNHIAHVPNIFGTYRHRNVTYDTVLTLVGLEDPLDEIRNSSRGMSCMQLKSVGATNKVWQFKIMIPKTFCCEAKKAAETDDPSAFTDFCKSLCDRTEIFAMEFLCCYKFFMEQVQETYQRGHSEVIEPVREKDKLEHPKTEEVEALICTYEGIVFKLKEFEEEYAQLEPDFSSIQPFLELHNGRNRKFMWPYYLEWLKKHRVNLELVEKRTMEIVAMNFLTEEHPC